MFWCLKMFSVILNFLIFFGHASALDKHTNNSEKLNYFGFSPTDNSLMGQFLRDMDIANYTRPTGFTGIISYFIVWHKISYLPNKVIQNEPLAVTKLLNNLFPLPEKPYVLPRIKSIIYGTFQHIISNLPLGKYEDDNWIFRKWYPFRDNIVGLAVYESLGKRYRTENIYDNQTEGDIERNNLKLAGFIPEEFLKKLSEGKSNEELLNVAVRMVVILNEKKFVGLMHQKEDVEHLVGVNIPGFCKNDQIPFMKGYFKYSANDSGDWMEFGKRYLDYPPEFIKQLCFLSQTVFVGRTIQDNHYDSVTENHCVISDSGVLTKMRLFATGDIKICNPNQFCLIKSQIPYEICVRGQLIYNNERKPPCQGDFSYPNRTRLFFEMLKFCGSMRIGSVCNDSLNYMVEHATTYFDVIIALDFLVIFTFGNREDTERLPNLFYNLFETALVLLEHETHEQITALTSLTLSITNHSPNRILKSRRFTSISFNFTSDIVGFISYKSNTSSIGYDVKLLTESNATLNYSSDPKVNVIAYITKPNKNLASACHLIAFYGNYVEYANQTLRSDVVGIYCGIDVIPLHVYLSNKDKHRRKEYYLNEGYSSIIDIKQVTHTTLYIFELRDTICDPISKLAIFEAYIPSTDFKSIHSGNLTFRNIDLLSHIALTVNEETQEAVEEQSIILTTLTFFLSSLSLAGTSCIFLSALFLKNWHQQRPYSIQLTISVAGETIFFLISESNISQTGYITFYYFLLSQFIWMLIIGYLQYIRYVKIFEAYELNIFKTSLVGWISPIVITLISILAHLECFQCRNFCSKNRDILMHFFIIPISIIVISNTAIYVYVMVMIARSGTDMFEPDARKARRWATMFLPSILGISWTVFGMLFIPNLGVSITGLYIFHAIASSQGLMIFIFVILLDKNTLIEWYQKIFCCKRVNNTVTPINVAFRARE